MERRRFLTGLFGLAGAAVVASSMAPGAAEAAPRLPAPKVPAQPDATALDDAELAREMAALPEADPTQIYYYVRPRRRRVVYYRPLRRRVVYYRPRPRRVVVYRRPRRVIRPRRVYVF